MSNEIQGESWGKTTISEEFHVQLGKRVDAAVNRGELKECVTNRAVRWGRVDVRETLIAPLTTRDISDLRLAKGDVLVCEGGEIGRASIWRGELPEAYYLNTLHRLRSRRGYEPRLLVAFLEYWSDVGTLSALVGRSSIAHLTKEHLLKLEIPKPSKVEQARISESLDSIEYLISDLERTLAKKVSIQKAVAQRLVTGLTRLPGFTSSWRMTTIGEILEIRNGLNKSSQFFGSGTPIINFMDVMNGPVITGADVKGLVSLTDSEIRRFSARRGDLFFTRTSETIEEIGTAAVLAEDIPDAVFSGFVLRGRPRSRDFDSQFLSHLFQSDAVRRQVASSATYTTRALINGRSLSRVVVAMPAMAEQRAISSALLDGRVEIDLLQRRLAKSKSIKRGMMQQLLTERSRYRSEEHAT